VCRTFLVAAITVCACAAGPLSAIVPSSGSVAGADTTQPATPVDSTANDNFLVDVACSNPTDCMAVGYANTAAAADDSTYQTLAEHWDGTSWTLTPTPNLGSTDQFSGVSCVSPTFCTAVGRYLSGTTPTPLVETWDGSAWTASPYVRGPVGSRSNSFEGVSCATTTNCVAVGVTSGSSQAPLIESWRNGSWTIATGASLPPGTSFAGLQSVSCASTTTCVAVGSRESASPRTAHTFAESMNGSTWSVGSTLDPGTNSNQLSEVSCPTTTLCLATGLGLGSDGTAENLTEAWNGSVWSSAAAPDLDPEGSRFMGVSCVSSVDCVVAGVSATAMFMEVWDGSNWTVTPDAGPTPDGSQFDVEGLACATGTGCLDVGNVVDDDGANQTFVESWDGTSWTTQPTPDASSIPSSDVVPTFTSPDTAAVTVNYVPQIIVGVTAVPTPTITESGALPPGLTFTDNRNGTATIDGLADPGDPLGPYPPVLLTATNPAGTSTQSLTLSLGVPNTISGPSTVVTTVGVPFDAQYAATGDPLFSMSGGTQPDGLEFVADAGTGVADLEGTLTQVGTYSLVVYADPVTGTQPYVPYTDLPVTLTVVPAPPACVADDCDQQVGTVAGQPVVATAGGATGLQATAVGLGGLTVGDYGSTPPVADPAIGTLGQDFDVRVAAGSEFTGLTVQDCDGITSPPQDSALQWFDPTSANWESVSAPVTYSTDPDCVAYVLDDSTSPSLTDLTGTVFAAVPLVPPIFTSADATSFIVGRAGSFQVLATGDPATDGYSETGTLPAGVTFAVDGTLSGTPAPGTSGTYPITITASNGPSSSTTQAFTLTVVPIGITSTGLPDGRVSSRSHRVTYAATLTAAGGNPPYKWSVSAGALPPGLKLDKGTGVISGRASATGVFSFTIRVVDTKTKKTKTGPSTQNTATTALSITITP
jgi:hypothetical protein